MVETQRLLIISFTYEMVEATLKGRSELEKVLGCKVSEEWPSSTYAKRIPQKKEKLKQQPETSIWSRIVIEKESNTLIGEIGCKGGPNDKGVVEIGYGLVSKARNKGYATEMVSKLTEWLLERPDVNKVTAECLDTNIPSARVLEKSGFHLIDHKDDMFFWGYKEN
ncbi:GNAT family N-acetyltransferase [Fictibacillus arsenicus]|uniref:GNAT family N-acetyltransferase n=1 Tax=Fictibacillus arsenicus TaxID=255247 RepID=A0A1B1Z8B6_9BACL|nr:GNAT family N-acetyltransferase [Fictibacillus arsenicus]ANX13631.1 GNAT family N-acetyltransferase [Fictibacillus arsenicus]